MRTRPARGLCSLRLVSGLPLRSRWEAALCPLELSECKGTQEKKAENGKGDVLDLEYRGQNKNYCTTSLSSLTRCNQSVKDCPQELHFSPMAGFSPSSPCHNPCQILEKVASLWHISHLPSSSLGIFQLIIVGRLSLV